MIDKTQRYLFIALVVWVFVWPFWMDGCSRVEEECQCWQYYDTTAEPAKREVRTTCDSTQVPADERFKVTTLTLDCREHLLEMEREKREINFYSFK